MISTVTELAQHNVAAAEIALCAIHLDEDDTALSPVLCIVTGFPVS
ncbi:MAG: hypothetical protein M3H12_07855 [Chromatiales bacterium]